MIRVNNQEMYSPGEIRFSNMRAMLEGAFHFVDYFGKLHSRGKVYGSSDPSRFFFDPGKGDLFFNGDDLLKEEGTPADGADMIMNEYLAPELVLYKKALEQDKQGGVQPESWQLETDWYFMSVFLFEYFFQSGSPFEGKIMVNHCFLSPEEKEYFRAEQGVFCMEPGDHGNRPVRGIQDKLIRHWDDFPEILKKSFQRAFLSGGMLTNLRPTELDWKQVLIGLMMDYKECDCGFCGFSDLLIENENGIFSCPGCGRSYYPLSDGLNRILLTDGMNLYECQTGLDACDYHKVTGKVVENRHKEGLFGIKNLSDGVWRGFYPDRVTREITKGQGIPIWDGMTLRFERGEDWTLRVIRSAEPFQEETGEESIGETTEAEAEIEDNNT